MCCDGCDKSASNGGTSDTSDSSNGMSLTCDPSAVLHNIWFWIAIIIGIAFAVSRKKK